MSRGKLVLGGLRWQRVGHPGGMDWCVLWGEDGWLCGQPSVLSPKGKDQPSPRLSVDQRACPECAMALRRGLSREEVGLIPVLWFGGVLSTRAIGVVERLGYPELLTISGLQALGPHGVYRAQGAGPGTVLAFLRLMATLGLPFEWDLRAPGMLPSMANSLQALKQRIEREGSPKNFDVDALRMGRIASEGALLESWRERVPYRVAKTGTLDEVAQAAGMSRNGLLRVLGANPRLLLFLEGVER